MPIYRTYCATSASIASTSAKNFPTPDVFVSVVPGALMQTPGLFAKHECAIIGDTEADTIEAGVFSSTVLCEFVSNIIVLAHASPLRSLEPRLAHTVGRSGQKGEFRQWFTLKDPPVAAWGFDGPTVARLWDALRDVRTQDLGRVLRALMYYRTALGEKHIVVRYALLYFGLEAINSTIQHLYDLPRQTTRNCKACGHATSVNAGLTGIRYVLVKVLEVDASELGRLNTLRAEIVHGFKPLSHVQQSAEELASLAERALQAAIWLSTGRPADDVRALLRDSASLPQPVVLKVSGELEFDRDVAQMPAAPVGWFELNECTMPPDELPDNQTEFSVSATMTWHSDSATIRPTQHSIVVPEGPEWRSPDICFRGGRVVNT